MVVFRAQKELVEAAVRRLDDRQLHEPLGENMNCAAVIMKHMAGNMLSRWTDFLTSDGEKPWRDRHGEFVDDIADRGELMALWERGWKCLFTTLEAMDPATLSNQVTIRGEPHTVVGAIHRQMDHYGSHVGQIVQLARYLAKDDWKPLPSPYRTGGDAPGRARGF